MKLWKIWQLFAYWGSKRGGEVDVEIITDEGVTYVVKSVRFNDHTERLEIVIG